MIKRVSALILAFTLMALPAGCADHLSTVGEGEGSIPVRVQIITAEQAKDMMDTQDVCILDVRTAEEYADAHIGGALLLPYDKVKELAEGLLPEKDHTILIYCRSGRRSAIAADTLLGLGYTDVYDFGGINGWPYDTVSGPPS